MKFKSLFLIPFSVLFLSAHLHAQNSSEGQKFQMEALTQQQDVIWGFDFLSDGRIIFTERGGSLKIFDPKSKSVSVVVGAPTVYTNGQGGLLDVRVHPTRPDQIFLTYAEPIDKGGTTAFGRGTLTGPAGSQKLTGFKKLFSAVQANSNGEHFGSRIEFDGEGHVFITVGDRGERKQVQPLQYHIGKIIRLNEDGSVPKDNPFVSHKNAKPEIWSSGHRSPQGLVRNPKTGDLWLAEMGPRGGDELNLIEKGKNYGWPIVTYGREYYGPKIGEGPTKPGMVDPVAYWVPSISPSGMTLYDGEMFPKWKGNLFIGNLSSQHLRRLVLKGQKVIQQEELLKEQGLRIRNVRPGPDGALYFSTDDGRIARLVSSK